MRAAVVLHADLDGVVSAALLALYLRREGFSRIELLATDHHCRAETFGTRLSEHDLVATVDFPRHPQSRWHFDHHHPAPSDGSGSFVDPSVPSCSLLVMRTIGLWGMQFPEPFRELVRWATIVDAHRYVDEQECFWSPQPALTLRRAIDLKENKEEFAVRALKLLLRYGADLEHVLQDPVLKRRNHLQKEALRETVHHLASNSDVVSIAGRLKCCVYQVERTLHDSLLPFVVHPDCQVALGRARGDGRDTIYVTANPWKKDLHVDLGELMALFGGGGHQHAAGVTVHSEDAAHVMDAVLEELKGKGPLGAFSAQLKEVELRDLLQVIGLVTPSAKVHVLARGRIGRIVIHHRLIVDASVDGLRGEQALEKILDWERGKVWVKQASGKIEPTCSVPVEQALLEAARRSDEIKLHPSGEFKKIERRKQP